MKFLRYIQKKRRAVFALAALTIFSSPFTAHASTITPKDASQSSKITFKNKVYTIEVQKKLSSQVGVNKFKDFNLNSGHIANIKFNDNVQTVANLVDNKISIDGTVNALRDGKIGGNLYFLSPNGIAVGATGVINAGSFTGMAVSQSYFDKLSKIDSAHTFMTELAPSKIQYNDDTKKGIDIQGVINAPGGISLYATKINVGEKAILRTNVEDVDFSKVVNIMKDDEVLVNSGIEDGLDASYSGGDIVLKAHAEHIADDNMLTNIQGAIDGKGTATRWIKDKSCEATINVDGKIDSAGDVNINADSKISFTEGSKFNLVTQSKILESILGNLGFNVMADGVKRVNKAKIDIGKTANIHSKGAMEIGAEATLKVTLSAQTPSLKTGATKIDNFVPAIAVAVIKADNKAEVNIKGKLESEGTMSITANAETELSNTAKAVTQLESEEIKKQLQGKSSVPEDHNFIAVGVIDGETKADVNISSGSKIKVNGADYTVKDKDNKDVHTDALTIKATTSNTVGNEVSATPNMTNVETASTTAVAVTNYTGTANVNLEDEVKAEKGNAVINANNTFINTGETSTGLGADPEAMEGFAEMPSTEILETLSVAGAKKISEKLFSSLKLAAGEVPLGSGNETFAKIFNGEFLKLGSSVSVFNQDNKANVNIGNNASITAKKDVDISSTNRIDALKLSTTAEVNNLSSAQKNKSMIGVGVQVSNIKNNADAVIKGSINSSAGNVNVTSYAGMNYNTVRALQDKFNEFFKSFRKQFEDGWESFKDTFGGDTATVDNLKSNFTMYELQIKKELTALENAKDPEAYMTALKTLNTKVASAKSMGFDAFVKLLDKGHEVRQSFEGLIPTLTSFLHPANYTNYYVRSAFSENKKPDDVTSSQLSGAGSFSINSMPNTSRVVFAENSKVAAAQEVNVKSNAENRIVAITGMGGEYGISSEAANKGVGISVKVGNFKNDSVIAIGKNVKFESKSAKIDSKEYAKHFNVIYGNGKADSTSVTGMVSYFNAPANNIISLDDSVIIGEDDDFANIYENKVGLNANSERYITTVTGALTLGNGNGKSFGATINVMNNPVNNAVILADNGTGTRSAITGTSLEDKTNAKILTLTNKTFDILGDYKTLLGTSSIDGTGEINAYELDITAKKTGTINAIAVAGTENSESHGFFDKFNEYVKKGSGYMELGEMAMGLLPSVASKYAGQALGNKLFHSGQNNAEAAIQEAIERAEAAEIEEEREDGGGGLGRAESFADLNFGDNIESQLNFAGAGSVAVNLNSGETGSFISNYKINADTSNITANDDTFHGAWAGAGAFNFFGDSEAAKNTNVAIGGSAAVNKSSTNVDSVVKNSTISASDLQNNANRADSDVAAGMGLSVSTNSIGTNVNIPISASINLLNGDTHALLIDNNFKGLKRIVVYHVKGGSIENINLLNGDNNSKGVERKVYKIESGSVSNKATIDSVQVAGGLALGVSKGESKGFSIGGNGAASQITNDLQSGIKGGSYENLSNVDITATKKSNQVDVAVAGGVTAGGNDNSGGFAFGGAVAVSDIKNTANAFLNDTTKFNATGIVNVDALENKNSSSRDSYLLTRKIDIDAASYLANNDKNKIATINGGGNIVNVAFGGGGSTSGAGAGGLGISYAGLTNTMNVDIADNQNITAKNFNANTTNKSNIVNVTVGFAGSKGNFSAAGSAGVSDIKNDGTINIKNSNVTADFFLSGAQSSAHIVNVAGQASLADKFAAGLTLAYNAMNNTTGINIEKGTWKVKDFGANSANNNYALAVGAGVTFSKESSAINGAIGLNIGTNSTKSMVDDVTINGIKNMKVTATDNTSKTTVAGGVNISKGGTVAIGGAVAYANIGKASNKEIITAKINKANITTENNSSIDVEALEKGIMTTVGAGVGGSVGGARLTFHGAAAVSEVNKDNIAQISNSNITKGTPDIKIKATSGGNSSDGLTINGSKIDVNNKIKTVAAVLDANFSNESWFDGAFAVSVNKFNQSTQANFKNNTQPEILSRAGNVDMYSNSEADILGIGIGGSGGSSTIGAAGSVSYNYINNSAKTVVENVNVKAAKNFGVVAQSDDKIANYAGTVDVDVNGRGAIGVSVAYNEIKGDTDANIKNSKLTVSGSDKDLIAISNPKDNLIDGYVTRNNWTSGSLMSGRTTANKSGLVVNSSATHSISSDLATIGVRATGSTFGAGVSGTVNINKIDGATNAKVEKTGVDGNANSFVNASDYTNNGSFIGNAAISGNVAIGVLWNENQVGRKTNALVDGGTLNVKNLDVKADNQQGISNLNIAVGASFMSGDSKIFAAASGDNVVRNQLEGTTTAKIENATVNHSGAVDVNAYHKDNIYATNIAAGVAVSQAEAFGVGATFDLGYGLMRENSTVEAEINNSTLTGGAVNVNAKNDSKLAGAFGTAGVAAHIGKSGVAGAVAVGINNIYLTNTVHAGIKDSTLNVGAVDVNAKNSSEVKADGGVAAVSANISEMFLVSLGAAVAVTNATFDNKVTADVDKSTINAAGDVNINAQDDHKSNETVVSAALSTGLAVSVNRMSTSINNGLANLQANQLGQTLSSKDITMTPSNASQEISISDSDKLTGEFGDEKRFLNENTIDNLLGGVRANSTATKKNISDILKKRYTATVNYNNSLKNGVFANVQNNSTIDAGENKISIGSTENNDLRIISGSGAGGIIGVGVGSTSIKVNRANTANVIGSSLKAKNIDISTTNGQTGSDGILSRMYNATLSVVGVNVGYNNVETNGSGEILISDSKITAAENLNAKATDNSRSKTYILDAGLKGAGFTGVFAYNTNTAQTGIEINKKSALTAKNVNFKAENHTYRATDTLAIGVNGINIPLSTSDARDTSKNFINVRGTGNTFKGDELTFSSLNGAQTYSHTNGQAYLGLNAIVAEGYATTYTVADIAIDNANIFLNKTVNLNAQIGEDGKYSAEATGFAINGSAIGINVDNMTARTRSTATIGIGNEIYSDNTTLNINALNKASRNAFMRNNAYSIAFNANDISAYTKANDKARVSVGLNSNVVNANKLAALNINVDTENKSYVAAKGTGGSIGGDFGSAAHADNDVNNTSEATLLGNWNIADALKLNANQHDSAYISGYSARGAILTGGKGSLDNVIKGSSTAKIADSAQITAKTVNINSKNYIKTDKYSNDYDYTLFGRMGGVVDDVDYQRSSATTAKNANINIGKNATITTTGTQTYDAASDYDLTNNVYAEGGSLLMSLRWSKSHNYITANENISVGTGATLKNEGGSYSDGGITMAAHDKLELAPTAKGFSQAGLGGYVRAENIIDLTRNQTIDINGTVKSAKDLNLYAGADAQGEGSKVHSYAQAISQVQTLFSNGSADIIRKGATNSNVNINDGAHGQAAHDVNIISNAGYEIYEERPYYGSTWSSDGGYKVATADTGNLTTANYKHNNKVKVDGELKAAATPDVTINISGITLPDGFILADDNLKNMSYNVKSGDITISKKNTNFGGKSSEETFVQQIYNGITTSDVDYANDFLKKRYGEVCQAISKYQVQGKDDIAAYNGILQEKIALENEMEKLGLGSYDKGEFKLDSSASLKIKTVVLPDVEVSGGSINVSTGEFSGKGKLNASGVPKIDINNKSSAYLITNRLTIADKGGAINYNGQAVTKNADIGSGAKFSEMKVAPSAQVPTIKVTNNYSGQTSIPMKPNPNVKGFNTLPEKDRNTILTYTPINYIEVTKDITNPVGKVQISNKQGSIRINKGAVVNAQNVEMTAKESISQGYTEGIINIAYTPEIVYKDEIAKLRDQLGWDKTIPTKDQTATKQSDNVYKGGSGRIAGEAIYIAARDININGLIQAGFSGYKASVTQKDVDNAKEQVFYNERTMYKVNSGGTKLGSDGYYIYEPQIYYDKTNNKLYVEDINATGGKVYLSGRVSSTGNGKIVVSDGASNINIINASKVDMNVGNVRNSGGGFIQIVDTEQDKLSEYSSGQTRTIENYSAWLADNTKGKVTTGDGLTFGKFVNYNPKSGLTYNWGEGTRRERTDHYHYKEEKWLWGFKDDDKYTSVLAALSNVVESMKNDKDYAKKYSKKASIWSEPEKSEALDVGNGVYIGTQNATKNNLTLLAQNVMTNESYGNHTIDGPDKHGFIGYYRDYNHRWTKTTGAKQIYQYSVKADYPISVGIIGESNPAINLTSSANSDLYLTGNIRNDNSATLNITARGGKIEQSGGTKISTNNIKLTARDGIKNIDITNRRTDDLKLNAQTNTGDVDISVQGGLLGDKQLAGNVIVDALKNNYDDVKLTAQGSIKQTIKGTAINARNIKLESLNGAINLQIESNGQSANVSAISAAAKGDINLIKNDNADFRIGSIVSTNGDVTLTAKGKFVDALDKVRDNVSNDESDLVKSWIDMGLIAGTADYKGAYINRLEKDRDNYKSDVTEQFAEYKTLLATYQSAVADYNSLNDKSKVTAPQKNDRLILLEKKFSKYETADAYLAADKDYQTLVETVKNPQYNWTEDELLSGIRSAIVNKQEGTAYDVTHLKDANITGRNVTLTGAGVGTNSKETTTIKMSELRVKANETDKEKSARLSKVSQLANVEAADVKVNLVLDADGKPITHTVTQINYNYDADKGYYIDKAGNYIRYRKDAEGNLLKYTYDKNLKQIGNPVAASDFSDVIKDTKTIENKEIESFEISGTIPLGINATGNISVTATGSDGVYIAGRNKGVKITETTNPNNNIYSPLNVNKIETTKADGNFADVRIIGDKGIFNAAPSGANVVGKDLVLVGGNGAIGTQEKPFAVSLSGDLLSARANDEINLQNVGANNFRISAIYSPKAIRIATNENGIIERSTRFDDIAAAYLNTSGEITLTGNAGTADNPILIRPTATTTLNLKGNNFYIKGMNSGTVNLNELSGNVEITSDGSIGQTKNSVINATSLQVAAAGDVLLTGNQNKLSRINVGEVGGNFEIKNNSSTLTANFNGTVNNAKINQTGNINLAGKFNGNVLSLATANGNINSTGGLQATKEINLNVGTFTHEGEIHTDKLTIATDNGVTINNIENTFNALEISSRSGKAINGSINVAIKADKFAPTIKNDVRDNVTLENTKTGGALSFGDGETINIGGTFTAITKGNFDYGSTLNAGKGISISAQNIFRRENTTGNFSATDTTLFKAKNNIGTAANPILFSNTANKSAGLDLFGKEIYAKGINSGIMTLGDAVGEFMSASSEGSIAQATDKNLNVKNKLELTATNDITLDNAENRINSAQINGDNVKLHSKADSGLILEGLKAKGDVMITSEKSLKLNGNIETAKNIALSAGTNLTSSESSVLKSGNNITLKADNVKLSGKVEMPYKQMTSNKVEDLKKFIEEMPVIEVTTNKGLDMRNAANRFNGVYVDAEGKLLNGSVLVLGNSPAFLAVIDKSVVNNIRLKNTKSDGEIILLDKGALKSKKGITLEMDGDFSAAAALEARNISITSHKGSITIAQLSSLTETAQTNSKNIDTLKAIRNVTLKAGKTIEIEGRITAGGNLKANSAGIDVFGKADVSAGNINLTIDKGNLAIEGKMRANKGAIDIKLGEGNVKIGNEKTKRETVVFAQLDINMTTSNGTIDIFGKTKSTSGNINIKAQKPASENTSANVPEFYSYDGSPVLFSANVPEIDSATLAPERPGDITIDAEVEANESIWIVTDEGNIKVAEKITVNDGSITIMTMNGNINIYSDIRAQNNLNIETKNGAVDIAGKVATRDGDVNISSNQGTYTQKGLTISETGAIYPARNLNMDVQNGDIEFKKIAAKNVDLKSINGNVTADTISAADTVRIALSGGDLYLNLAQSKGVAILTGDSSNSTVNTIRANSVDVSDAVTVGKVLPYRTFSTSTGTSTGTSSGTASGGSTGYSNNFSNIYGGSYSRGGYSNFASNLSLLPSPFSRLPYNGLTYWQSAPSATVLSLLPYNDMTYRQTRNYFEVKFIPTWLEKEFMTIDYSFDNFGIKNASEDELIID